MSKKHVCTQACAPILAHFYVRFVCVFFTHTYACTHACSVTHTHRPTDRHRHIHTNTQTYTQTERHRQTQTHISPFKAHIEGRLCLGHSSNIRHYLPCVLYLDITMLLLVPRATLRELRNRQSPARLSPVWTSRRELLHAIGCVHICI
jgi:hypothetical protein